MLLTSIIQSLKIFSMCKKLKILISILYMKRNTFYFYIPLFFLKLKKLSPPPMEDGEKSKNFVLPNYFIRK